MRAFDDDMTRRKHSGRGRLRAFDDDTTRRKHSGYRDGADVGCRHDEAETLWVRMVDVGPTKQKKKDFGCREGCGRWMSTRRSRNTLVAASVRAFADGTTSRKHSGCREGAGAGCRHDAAETFWVRMLDVGPTKQKKTLAVAKGAGVGCRHDEAETLWFVADDTTRRKHSGCRGGAGARCRHDEAETFWLSRGCGCSMTTRRGGNIPGVGRLRVFDVATTKKRNTLAVARVRVLDVDTTRRKRSGCREVCGCSMLTRRDGNILGVGRVRVPDVATRKKKHSGCREGAGARCGYDEA